MHEGHRSRLVGKIKNSDSLYEHELLEVLLFNACPRKDVNATAHKLIDKFGNLFGVLCAQEDELIKVEGVGRNMAQYLVCLGKCLKACRGCSSFSVVRSTAEFRQFISLRFCEVECDALELYALDKDGRVKRVCLFCGREGARAWATAEELLKFVSVYKPYGVFAAYYRADGDNEPTDYDDELVRSLGLTCSLSGVRFYDYCIACRGKQAFSYFVADRLVFGNGGYIEGADNGKIGKT